MAEIHKLAAPDASAVINEVAYILQHLSGSLGLLAMLAGRDDDEMVISPHDLHAMTEMLRGQAAIAYRKLSSLN
ncbi:MAG TPA: hypothetical protein DDZ88_14810 [Verrucomicrobiales bacterium]|nr:hypothetical protein [Verrucomicrobiales bacterium]